MNKKVKICPEFEEAIYKKKCIGGKENSEKDGCSTLALDEKEKQEKILATKYTSILLKGKTKAREVAPVHNPNKSKRPRG